MGWWRIGTVAVALLALVACNQGNVFSMEPGMCFDDVDEFFSEGGGEVGDVPLVDCEDPHDNEVYALFDLPDGDFPGGEVVNEQAGEGCHERFEPYVARDYATSRYAMAWLTPTTSSWANGDREIVCFLYDVDLARLEGSARGSGA